MWIQLFVEMVTYLDDTSEEAESEMQTLKEHHM
jgi:hypothetical protein